MHFTIIPCNKMIHLLCFELIVQNPKKVRRTIIIMLHSNVRQTIYIISHIIIIIMLDTTLLQKGPQLQS